MLEILASIGTALTAGGTGGLLGIVGSIASGWVKNQAANVELRKEEMRFKHRVELLKMQAQQSAGDRDLEALRAAIESDTSTNNERVSTWVANIKSLWRPALTLLLLVLTAVIFFSVLSGSLVLAAGTPKAIIISNIANGVVFLGSLSVSFWFGSRGIQPDRISHDKPSGK